jgi:hypothetical protein
LLFPTNVTLLSELFKTYLTDENIDISSYGSKYSVPLPAISGNELVLLQTKGQPQANDSKIGIPNPSYKDGNTNNVAFL